MSGEKMKTMIGGQALMEGIMMRGPEKDAVVVRTPEGLQVDVKPRKLRPQKSVLNWPFLRGIVGFFDSQDTGVNARMHSAEQVEGEEAETPSKLDLWLEKKLGSEKMEKAVEKTLKRKADKLSILGLCSLLVWFVALLIFVVLTCIPVPYGWLAFFFAAPADAIVMLSLRSAWRDFRWNRALISATMWGCLVSMYMTLLILGGVNIWRMFLLGIPGQAAILLWFRMFRPVRNREEEENG